MVIVVLAKIFNQTPLRFPLILILSIFLGSLLGFFAQQLANFFWDFSDYLIFTLVFLLIFDVPFEKLFSSLKNIKTLSIMWVSNFIIIPTIGFLVASIFLSGYPLVFTGIIIYFMAPCTDWFLGFIKVAKGNTSLGTISIPINMLSQLLLYPVYIFLFTSTTITVPTEVLFESLFIWFFLPFILAIIFHFTFKKVFSKKTNKKINHTNNFLVEGVLSLLVLFIFAAHILVLLDDMLIFFLILLSVFIFFLIVYSLTEFISNKAKLNYEDHVTYTVTTAARNAPLMLALTTLVFPNEPLIYSAIIVGMLVEFPHLAFLTTILLKKRKKQNNTN